MNKMKQISEVAEENAAMLKNMKTNDDNNMMSSTTKNDSPQLKMKMTFFPF